METRDTKRKVGCFKNAKDFIYQKVQNYRADSGYVAEINDNQFFNIFSENLSFYFFLKVFARIRVDMVGTNHDKVLTQ